MFGLDLAAGAAGLFGLSVTLFQGCVKGFVLLSTAHNFGSGADLARCKIEIEQYRLFEWAESVNLEGNPSQNLNWKLIEGVLRQLLVLMTDTQKLRKEYGLILEPTDDDVAMEDIRGPKAGLKGRLAWLKPKFLNETAQRLQKSSTPWKRLKWAACDDEGLRLLIGDIVYLNNSLENLLERADREASRAAFGMVLRTLVAQSSIPTELSQIQSLLSPVKFRQPDCIDSAVAAAASLKQSRLIMGFDETSKTVETSALSELTSSAWSSSSTLAVRQSPSSSSTRPSPNRRGRSSAVRLKLEKLSGYASSEPGTPRELARYEGEPVLVEWKNVDHTLNSKLKHRIEDLASLLSTTSHPSFHALHCRGYLKDSKSRRYAYIFTPPKLTPPSSQTKDTPYEVRSLLELLCLDGKKPELNERISLALALTETLQQLHTSGWLHKGIRSENVLFFNYVNHNWTSSVLSPVFLAGYEYARADSPLDITETPAARHESDIYRHPSLISATPATYVKRFDLYSLGCVLLEIGLWRPLQTALVGTIEDSNGALNINKMKYDLLTRSGHGSIHEELKFCAGSKFANAVANCFTGGDAISGRTEKDEGSNDEEDGFDHDEMLDTEQQIIEILRNCMV